MNQKEIARLAGVSSATVSRVINNDPKVSLTTARRVLDVIAQHGYVQNTVARSLRMATTSTIGFLISDIANPFFPAVLRGIEAVCARHGYNLLLQNTDEAVDREKAALDTLLRSRVDGLIAILIDETGGQLDRFKAMGIPIVLVDRKASQRHYDCVTVDSVGGVAAAIRYLAALGHRRIATIHGIQEQTPGKDRLEGFIKGMAECNLPVIREYVVDGQFTEDGGYRGIQHLMALPNPPTAVVTANNMLTMGAYRGLRDLDVSLPDHISLVGFDDFPLAGYLTPPITVIQRPTVEMGEAAADILLQRIFNKGKGERQWVQLPTSLLVRESCRAV